ncbi:hypothetical protein PDE_07025 [Penicillium oxalicum 114-2]|uniref:RBR-type E3 ubiquitin transferase n=1 Tax=Penicillium oxalicum (strain 114-2 / CGMCC 5302) TaxID=933388 RepID=S7ZTH3_PENO1|nr:hypothetical protein PDE_07025 [Penicillium oxalicum 114-2]
MTAHIRTPFPSGQSSSLQRSEVPRLNETPREASSAFSVPFDWGLPSPSNRPNLEAVPNEEEREDHAVPAVVRNSMRSLRETVAALEGQTERGANSLAFSQRKNECSCCFEKISAPCYISLCEHTFCTDCLRQLFLRAARNESQFPPRCCGTEFRQETVRKVLTGSEFQEYDIRTEEFNASPRIYCADPKCSQFIRPASIMNDLGTCSSCQKQTHVPCRALAHPGRDCPVDNAQQSVIDLAEQNEWRRCYHCQTVVELRYGCNEVLCRCGHTFCYKCGRKWKTCDCQNWYRSNVQAPTWPFGQFFPTDIDAPPRPPFVTPSSSSALPWNQPFSVPGALAIHRPRCENHRHAKWTVRNIGLFRCAICSNVPRQTFDCQVCHMMVCNTCKAVLEIEGLSIDEQEEEEEEEEEL